MEFLLAMLAAFGMFASFPGFLVGAVVFLLGYVARKYVESNRAGWRSNHHQRAGSGDRFLHRLHR